MRQSLSNHQRKLLRDWFNRSLRLVPEQELHSLVHGASAQQPAFATHFAGRDLLNRAGLELARRIAS